MTSAEERKRVELAAKVTALRDEFAHWRSESASGKPLEKHHSQILRITTRFDSLAGLLAEELEAAEVLDQWRSFEGSLLDVHHLWDFYRTKFATRYAPWLRDTLIVGDDLVWACYEPAQRAAVRAGHIDPAVVREPPLTFFSSDTGPVAVARHAAYHVRGRGAELLTDEYAGELDALPVPVTAVPWHQAGHLPDVLMLAHEAGHHVEDDFGLTPHLNAVVHAGLTEAGTPKARKTFWLDRLGEIFADVYGVLAAGAAYVATLADFLAAPAPVIAAEPAALGYPPAHLRVQIALAALRLTCPSDPRVKALTDAWWTVHPTHDHPGCDADVLPLVHALLMVPCPAFGAVPPTDVLSFGPTWREAGVDAARLAAGRRPESSNPRALLAAAALVFHDDPKAYRASDVAGLTRARVLAVQARGVRFRSYDTVQPELLRVDRAAGESLYHRLARRHGQAGPPAAGEPS